MELPPCSLYSSVLSEITTDDLLEKQKKIEQEEKSQKTVIDFIVIMIISAIIYTVSTAIIYNF